MSALVAQRKAVTVTSADLRQLPEEIRFLAYPCGREASVRGDELAAALRHKAVRVVAIVPDDQLAFRDAGECAMGWDELQAIREGESLVEEIDRLHNRRPPSVSGRLLEREVQRLVD